MADIGFTVALEGINQMQQQLDKLRQDVGEKAKQTQGKLAGISDFFVQSLKQNAPIIGRAVEAFTNPMQAGVQIVADFVGSLGGFVESANEAAQVSAQLDAGLKSTGNAAGITRAQLDDLAESLAAVTLADDDAIRGVESLLLTFTAIGKEAMPQVTEAALDLSQKFGQDLKSSAIQLGKAMQDPIAGATALRRIGVQLTDQQEKQIKTFVELGDIASAQKVILGELAKETGGAARAAAQAGTGPWQQFKKQLGEIGESIGSVLIPVLNTIAKVLGPIAPILLILAGAFATVTIAVIAYNSAIVTTILNTNLFGNVTVGSLIKGLGKMAAGFVASLGPIGWVAAGIGAVVAAIQLIPEPTSEALHEIAKFKDSAGIVGAFGKAADDAAKRIDFLADSAMRASAQVNILNGFLSGRLSLTIVNGTASIVNYKDELEKLRKEYEAMPTAALASQILHLEKLAASVDVLTQMRNAESAAIERQKKAQEELEAAQARGIGTIADFEFQISQLKKAVEVTNDKNLIWMLNNQVDNLQRKIDDLQKGTAPTFAFKITEGDNSGMAATLDALEGIVPQATDNMSSFNEVMRQTDEAATGVATAMRDAFDGSRTDAFIAQMKAVEAQMKQLGESVKANVASAFGDLAFNMGMAVATGQDLGLVMQQFISDLLAQVGKMIGMAFINMALTAPFPLSLGFLGAGLAILGLSGLISGALKPKGAGQGAAAGTQPQQPQQVPNAPGLSSFNESQFNPIINIDGPITLEVGGEKFDAYLTTRENKTRRRRGK